MEERRKAKRGDGKRREQKEAKEKLRKMRIMKKDGGGRQERSFVNTVEV